jgi:formyltetrahydrofolate hydrolase
MGLHFPWRFMARWLSSAAVPTTLPDRVGLLARISGWVAEQGGNLVEVHQFTDPQAK